MLPQFTTMNVIDGQAGLISYFSLIFYSLTIDNILNIIVLLILAGVSIATLTGENGILTRAGDAKTNTEIAEEKEAIGLAYNGVMAENRGNGVSAGELQAELISNGYDVTASGSNPITVKFNDSQRVYTVDNNGNIEILDGSDDNNGTTLVNMFIAGESCENPDNCDNEEHLHVGDYLKYTPSDSTASTADMEDNPLKSQYTGVEDIQTYTVNSNTKWQVIGLSEDKQHVLLTTESPIQKDGTDPYLKLGGAEGYIYCKKVLDGICSIYANDDLADEVRSMTMEDITNVLGITIDKEENKAYNKNGTEISGFQGFFGTKNQYIYKSTEYAPENYVIEQYNDTSYTRKATGSVANILSATRETIDQSAYMIPYTESSIVDSNSAIYDVLFSGTTEENNFAKSYWLASPGVYVFSGDGNAYFSPGVVSYGYAAAGGYNLFSSYGYRYASSFAVRPVVSLKSEIKGSEIERDVASTSDIWDGKVPDLEGESLGRVDAGQVTTE